MRRILLSAAKILVSALLMYFALRETNFTDLSTRLNVASAGWLGLAIALAVFQIYIAALRWRAIGADCDAPISAMRAFRYSMVGSFFNQTLPSAIGGDAVRLWLVARAGAGWRAATYSVFVDRAIGLIALAALILFTLPWSLSLIDNPEGRPGLVLLDLAAVGAGLAFLLLNLLRFEFLTRIWATRHFYACSQIASRILFNRGKGPVIAAVSLLINVLAVVVAWCVARAIAAPADLAQLILLFSPGDADHHDPDLDRRLGIARSQHGPRFLLCPIGLQRRRQCFTAVRRGVLPGRRFRRSGVGGQRREGGEGRCAYRRAGVA